MKLREILRISGRSIRAHRLRSSLTVLGVVIGIASVIVFSTFGASVRADVVGQIGTTNANNIYVFPGEDEHGAPTDFGSSINPVFTTGDVEEISEIEGVRKVIPRGIIPVSSLSYANRTVAQQTVIATVPETFSQESVLEGRGFRSGSDEIVMNRAGAEAFGENVTVGSTVVMTDSSGEETELRVVGVVSSTQGEFVTGFGDAVPRFYLPSDPFYTTTVTVPGLGYDQKAYPQMTVVADTERVGETGDGIEEYLSRDSDASGLVPDNSGFTVQTSGDIIDEIEDVIDRITKFVTGIAVISLVVGAVGIANITLVSVTERTKEIGIMKSVGATNRDVVKLFLTEAVLLSTAGSVIGIPIGLGIAWGATVYAGVGFTPAVGWVVFSVFMGVTVGVVAGIYPAWRASKVNPIDALRYE